MLQGFVPELDIDVNTFNGSLYADENFSQGQIIDKLSQKTISSYLRYEVYRDVFQMNTTASDVGFEYLKTATDIEVVYLNEKYSYRGFTDLNGSVKRGYLKELLSLDKDLHIFYRQEKNITSRARSVQLRSR